MGGAAAYIAKYNKVLPNEADFNYSEKDSLYFELKRKSAQKNQNNKKIVDSKQELLDFSKDKFEKKKKLLPNEKIKVNSADLETLIKLPGIGRKTAQKIIEFRNLHGKFDSINDLLKIKGIGKKKLSKFKKFIIID